MLSQKSCDNSPLNYFAEKRKIIKISQDTIAEHLTALKSCTKCPKMIRPVVTGLPILSEVMLVGQAPGIKEGTIGRPFAWTAGKTLFQWFASIGISEEQFRSSIYISAICRCFPGKSKSGSGDRVPDRTEIENCSVWINKELELVSPQLIIPVGRLAINRFIEADKLEEIIGKKFLIQIANIERTVIPLPHPSGASPWPRIEPGKTLLKKALALIQEQKSFQSILINLQ